MGKFVIKTVKSGYMFNLKAGNGEIIATSEIYSSITACQNGIESVKKNASSEVEDQTVNPVAAKKHPKYEMYKDKAGEYRFRLKSSNGEIIAVSEGYTAIVNCKNGIESVKKNAATAEVETV